MELRQLEYFLVLCEVMQFTKAAERLLIAQPTLSQQIKILEQELGTPLFHRIGKKISLTDAGYILLEQARTMFQTLDATKEQIQQLDSLEKGTLRIGALPGELTNLVSSISLQFMKQYPNIQVHITSNEDIHEMLRNNMIEVGFTFSLHSDQFDQRFEETALYKEAFCYIERKDNDMCKDVLTLPEALSKPLVLFPNAHLCRRILNHAAKTEKLPVTPRFETSSIDSIFSFVEQGLGGTIVAKTLFDLYGTSALQAYTIDHPLLQRETLLITQKERQSSPTLQAFNELLAQELTKFTLQLS
ncbi:LysR family transcriptional regulator [Caryophanon tenue]|uniref:Transcriptional regulator n=1 Tax=Caryophanon tenue TaxID=33978 RepID=A0A1C0YEU3_9BACL|nr:LysR family transcriptional regulator [Caryophanon tenue]OCS85654.1 transcriptional regulator [Caryophanon tenue]